MGKESSGQGTRERVILGVLVSTPMAKNNFNEVHTIIASELARRGLTRVADRATTLRPGEFGFEFLFALPRKWRFDTALRTYGAFAPKTLTWNPSKRIAIEVDGGGWQQGRHNRALGKQGDDEKRNEAQILGWVNLTFTPSQILRGEWLSTLDRALGVK